MAGMKGNEGVSIAKNRFKVDHIEYLTDDKWFVLQTNDDHWTGICTTRCSVATQRIKAIG